MKFGFKNFARAGEGVIDVNELTVICGPNNTGKTYINYAIFSILSNLRENFDIGLKNNELKRIYQDLKNTGISKIKLSKQSVSLDRLFPKLEKEFASAFHQYFRVSENNFSNLEISLEFPKLDIKRIKCFTGDLSIGLKGNITNKNGMNLSLSVSNSDNMEMIYFYKEYVLDNLKKSIETFIFDAFYSELILRPFPITSERTGISLFYKLFDSRNSAIVNSIDGMKERVGVSDIENLRADLALPIQNNIDSIRYYQNLTKQNSKFTESPEKYNGVLNLLSELLSGGEFSSTNDAVMFHPAKNTHVFEPPIFLHAASSSVKSLFLMDLYVKHVARENQILIIDKPELNLFPSNQAKMARLVARLVNSGIKVLVTTHSDYFVREINNLIALSNVKEDKDRLMKEYGIENEELLDFENVSAYNTTEEFRVEAMIVDKFGIDTKILNSIIQKENEKNSEIVLHVE